MTAGLTFCDEIGKPDRALRDFGGVGASHRSEGFGLVERVGANSSAGHTEASNGSKKDKATS